MATTFLCSIPPAHAGQISMSSACLGHAPPTIFWTQHHGKSRPWLYSGSHRRHTHTEPDTTASSNHPMAHKTGSSITPIRRRIRDAVIIVPPEHSRLHGNLMVRPILADLCP